MEKKNLFLVVSSLLVIVISVTVAYFSVQIIGNGKDLSVTSANLQIVFSDSDGAISDSNIEPGWSSTKTFKVTNNSKSEYKYNIVLKDLVNTFVTSGYLQYKITSTNNGYNTVDYQDIPKSSSATDTVLAYNISISVGTTQSYTIEFKYSNDEDVDQSDDMGMKLSGTLFITEGTTPTLYTKLLADKSTRPGERKDFSTPYTKTNTNTLFTSTENDTPVYYFAGDARDNWVKFGTWSEDKTVILGYSDDLGNGALAKEFNSIEECNSNSTYTNCKSVKVASKGDPMYWRIVRTNSDGSIRLLYSGTNPNTQTGFIGTSAFNEISTVDPLYIGYMFGTSGSLESNRTNENNSTVKIYIDNWYQNNLNINFSKYLSETAVYCNDRTLSKNYPNYVIGDWLGFAPEYRLHISKSPTYNCENIGDKFTVSTSTGNGKLTYPVGLITADEASYAGGVFYVASESPFYYLYSNTSNESVTNTIIWWTMSPNGSSGNTATGGGSLHGVCTSKPGRIGNPGRVDSSALRPVISLKGDNLWKSGDGTSDNPYEIELN